MTTTQAPAPARPAPTAAELESSLEAYFYHAVRVAGGLVVKLAPTVRGIPDRLVFLPGGVMALVELKATGGALSPIQRHRHAELATLGTPVVVLTGRSEVATWIGARFAKVDATVHRGRKRYDGKKPKP